MMPRPGPALRTPYRVASAAGGARYILNLLVDAMPAYDRKANQQSIIAKALSSERRLLLLEWLVEPDKYFCQRAKWPIKRKAVATSDISRKWNVGKATLQMHLRLLKAAGLIMVVRHEKIRWVIRSSKGISKAKSIGHLYLK